MITGPECINRLRRKILKAHGLYSSTFGTQHPSPCIWAPMCWALCFELSLSQKAGAAPLSRGCPGHLLGTSCLLSPGGTDTLRYSSPGPPSWCWAQGLPGAFITLSSHLQLCGVVGLQLGFSRMFVNGSKPRKRLQFSLSNNSWLYLLQEILKHRQNRTFKYMWLPHVWPC